MAAPIAASGKSFLPRLFIGAALAALSGCGGGALDWDMRSAGTGLNTSTAAQQVAEPRPATDSRGVISYPSYQVAVAARGDTVTSMAGRIGLPADQLARFNGMTPQTPLRQGEVLVLPQRVAEAGGFGGGLPATPGAIDITTLASGAIERAEGAGVTASAAPQPPPPAPAGREPLRHTVVRGETAYSIARLYGVSVRSLADWNGLGPDLGVREGQFLMIPVPGETRVAAVTPPGAGSPTPTPPSAAKPLPAPVTTPPEPPSPDMSAQRTAASGTTRLAFPAQGSVIRAYAKGKNEGIDIGAAAGAPVRAAADGTVAAITQDTEQVPILVIRHADNLLTVYANIDGIRVAKGATVKRGDQIAAVRAGNPSFLHFEVRDGFESVDPVPFLQ